MRSRTHAPALERTQSRPQASPKPSASNFHRASDEDTPTHTYTPIHTHTPTRTYTPTHAYTSRARIRTRTRTMAALVSLIVLLLARASTLASHLRRPPSLSLSYIHTSLCSSALSYIRSRTLPLGRSSRTQTNPLQDASYSKSSTVLNSHSKYTAVVIVPTGIGASVGGYAGDALPATRLLSSVVDTLITHPNVLNGASLYWHLPNALYVEGYALDEFAAGKLGLQPVGKGCNRIGLLLDRGIEEPLRIRHLQAADAARATLGIPVTQALVTAERVGVKLALSPSGASWGTITNPHTLIEGAKVLVTQHRCSAIAVVARFPEDEDNELAEKFEMYRQGQGVDTVGGAEALISHLITSEVGVPCAHAPAMDALDPDPLVHPKACAEELGYTFLPCVLANLWRAPQLVRLNGTEQNVGNVEDRGDSVWASHVDAVVVPATAVGSPAVLALYAAGKLVIAVEDNTTKMTPTPEELRMSGVVRVRSYLEAAGLLAAHKAGIFTEALTTDVRKIPLRELRNNGM